MVYLEFVDRAFQRALAQPWTVKVVFGAIALVSLLYSVLTKVLPKLLLVPPHNWIDKVVAALNTQNMRLRSSNKTGSYRRRLVLGSLQPSLYSTTATIKTLKIPQLDSDHKIEFLTNCKIKPPQDDTRRKIYGMFHPYCNSGGGGEKVLWELVHEILVRDERNIVAIYHGESSTPREILLNVEKIFHLDMRSVSDRIVFIYLENRRLIDPKTWPVFTLVGQAVGTVILAFEAIYKLSPDVWVDTVGLPFSYPLIGLILKIPILAYTHFPVIQSDMLAKLNLKSPYGLVKYLYWYAFLLAYKLCGSFVSLALVNSTWTYNHMVQIWSLDDGRIVKCYPVCSPDLILSKSAQVTPEHRDRAIVSLSQFRDEKRHDLILQEYAKYLAASSNPYKLKFIGSTRSDKDLAKVESLKSLVKDLEIPDGHVEFLCNVDYAELLELLVHSEIGLNAMWNEHFGIVVVEYLAAGLIPVVHASAGPLLDIVVPWDLGAKKQASEYTDATRSGFYFKSESDPDFAASTKAYPALHQTLLEAEKLTDAEREAIRERGRAIVQSKFSNDEFRRLINQTLQYVEELEVFLRVDKRDKVEQMY